MSADIPKPGKAWKLVTWCNDRLRVLAASIKGSFSGCSDACSTDADIRMSSFSSMSSTRIFVTFAFPSVMVPVLSIATKSIHDNISNVCAFLINIPRLAPWPIPAIIAVGVANPNAHGQDITRTLMAFNIPVLKLGSGPQMYQPRNVRKDIDMIVGTK